MEWRGGMLFLWSVGRSVHTQYLYVSNSQNCLALMRHSLFAANSVNDSDKTETRDSGVLRYSIHIVHTLWLTDSLKHRRAHTKFAFGRRHDTKALLCWLQHHRCSFGLSCLRRTIFYRNNENKYHQHTQYINRQSLCSHSAYRLGGSACVWVWRERVTYRYNFFGITVVLQAFNVNAIVQAIYSTRMTSERQKHNQMKILSYTAIHWIKPLINLRPKHSASQRHHRHAGCSAHISQQKCAAPATLREHFFFRFRLKCATSKKDFFPTHSTPIHHP